MKRFAAVGWGGRLLAAFLLLGLPAALCLALLTPLGHVPDEPDHACRADSLRHGAWIGHREMRDGRPVSGVPCNDGLRLIMQLPAHPTDPTPEPYTAHMRDYARTIPWAPAPGFAETGSIGGYMPALYVPGALAITATRAFGGSPAQAFMAIRLANLACFALIGALAIAVALQGTALIACTLLLPMTLSLAASCSQDGMLIALATLACAALTRARDRAGAAWFALAAACLALVIASKPPYAPLALLLLMPQPRRIGRNLAAATAAILPALLWVGLELHFAAVAPYRPPAPAGPFWPGAPTLFAGPDFAAQCRVLLAAPARLFTLPYEAVVNGADMLAHQAVGVLDYLCIFLPRWLYDLWFVAIAAAALADAADRPRRPAWLPLAAIWLSATCVGLALYLQWTPVGMPWIGGLEGRYFLPLLPVLSLALPAVRAAGARGVFACMLVGAAGVSLVWVPLVVRGFYKG